MLHVFIADDDEQVRFGLRTLLSLTGNVEIVGEADRIDRLVSGTLLSQPDVVLLDWELPGRVDPSVFETLHGAASRPKIIALSTHADQEQPALAAGAEAFICKADPPKRLLTLLLEQASAVAESQHERTE